VQLEQQAILFFSSGDSSFFSSGSLVKFTWILVGLAESFGGLDWISCLGALVTK